MANVKSAHCVAAHFIVSLIKKELWRSGVICRNRVDTSTRVNSRYFSFKVMISGYEPISL